MSPWRNQNGQAELRPSRQGSTGHLGFELFKRWLNRCCRRRLSGLSADIPDIARPDQLDLPVREPGAGARCRLADPHHRCDQRPAVRNIPDVPTLAEQGYAEAQVRRGSASWCARYAGAGCGRSAPRWRQRSPTQTCAKTRHRRLRTEERATGAVGHIIKSTSRCGEGGQGCRYHGGLSVTRTPATRR